MRLSIPLPPIAGAQINRGAALAHGLVRCWPLNDGGSIRAQEIALGVSGIGPTVATLSGMSNPATATSGWGAGAALRFDGSDDYLSAPQGYGFPTAGTPWSVAFWMLDDTGQSGLATFHRIVSWYDGTTNHQIALGRNDASTQRVIIAGRGGFAPSVVSSDDLPLGPHHILVTCDGSSSYGLYVDGIPSAGGTSTGALGAFSSNSTTVYLGQRGDGAGFLSGQMGLPMLWARVLTADDAMMLAANPILLFTRSHHTRANRLQRSIPWHLFSRVT